MPTAPASTCARAIAGILCVFTCGLSATPLLLAIAAIFSMFLAVLAPSISRCGVSGILFPSIPEFPSLTVWPRERLANDVAG